MRNTDHLPHVVVLGAGFAGASALRALADADVRVTVVDQHPYNTFRPLLYQVATGGLNPGDITYPLRTLSARNRARYRRAKVTGVDRDHQQVLVDSGPAIDYDYLIIGIGSTTNHFGIPGAAEHSMSMYTRADALRVRDAIFSGLEKIAGQSSTGTGGFTIVVVGGGATGVEMAGAIAELKSAMLTPTFPELNPSEVNVILVEMTDALLLPFEKGLQRYALRQLIKRGVDVRLKTAIAEIAEDHVILKDGTQLHSDLVIWAAGVAGYPEVSEWGLPIGKGGRIEIGSDLRVHDHDRVFAVGDAAVDPDHPLAQLAPPAMQMGVHAAQQIVRLERGLPTEPFHYHDRGIMATIGNKTAVVQLSNGLKITGLVAWAAWVALHLWYLLGGRNRVETIINLVYRYLIWPSQTAAIVGDVETPDDDRPDTSQAESA
ncbi:6-phosphogluconate dehydrogenase [Microlunatus endophyticus]|uniref:6-phosphogluconate dehydrogenase n=1 Tax=Microlunatus endophyticus TaxID=1716077 RepID=A0A917S8D9_9ACTN|nr:NAD(P)/FAD-dependent oxidoreductase [Microlunatus endophyticus]GGL64157.1 6-phosphogluconate dehydrogenase [Microlunatus endophyticus]